MWCIDVLYGTELCVSPLCVPTRCTEPCTAIDNIASVSSPSCRVPISLVLFYRVMCLRLGSVIRDSMRCWKNNAERFSFPPSVFTDFVEMGLLQNYTGGTICCSTAKMVIWDASSDLSFFLWELCELYYLIYTTWAFQHYLLNEMSTNILCVGIKIRS